MKKLILLLLIVPIFSFGQVEVQLSGQQPTYSNPYPQPIKVQVQNNSSNKTADIIRQNSENMANNIRNMAANNAARASRETAAAARAAAMSKPLSDIKTPITIDLYNYESIAIVDATFASSSGAQVASKSTYNSMADSFSNSPLTVINPTKFDRKKFRKNRRFLRDVKNPKWLYAYYTKSIQGVDEIRSLVVRNHQNSIIYHITTTNISADETISAIVNF